MKEIASNRGRLIRRSISWNAVNLIFNKGSTFLLQLALARLLMPEHFGLVSMVVVALGLIKLFVDFGMTNALIQRRRDKYSSLCYSSAFWFLLVGGILWTSTFVAIGAPLLTTIYGEPELTVIARVMGLSLLFQSAAVLPKALLTRRMKFKALVVSETTSVSIAAVIALCLALADTNAWALAIQQLSASVCRTFMLWSHLRWRPRLTFSWSPLHQLSRFSGWMLGNQVIHYMRKNLDKMLIGYLLGAATLGVYNIAYMLTETLRVSITGIAGQVLFPVYSRVQLDRQEVARIYLKSIRYMTLIVFPISVILITFADHIINLLFGSEWAESAIPLRILALASMIFVLSGDPSAVLRGIGKPDLAFRISFWNTLIVGIPALAIGTWFFGAAGAAWGVVAHYSTSRIVSQLLLRREIPIREIAIAKSIFPAVAISLLILSLSMIVTPGK